MEKIDALIKKYDIKSPFIHKGFHAKFYPIDFVQILWNRWGDYSGYYYKLHISVLHDDYWDLYYLPEEFTGLRNSYFAKIDKDQNFLDKHYSDWQNSCVDLNDKISYLKVALDKGDFSEIFEKYKEFVEAYVFEYSLSAPIQEACGFQPEQWIIPAIENYVKKHSLNYDEIAPLLMSPITHSFVSQEEMEIFQISLSHQSEDFEDKIKKHQEKWFWLQNNYSDIKSLSFEFFKNRVTELVNLGGVFVQSRLLEIKIMPENIKKKKKDLFSKFSPSSKLTQYIKIVELFAEMQDVRKSFVLHANHYHKLFLEVVSKQFERNMDELWFYTWRELFEAVTKGVFIEDGEIKNRKIMIAEVESQDGQTIFSGKEAKYFFDKLQDTVMEVGDFKGIIAQRGQIHGIVKIVLKSEDIEKVLDGDVMVSSMTRPEMTAAMKRAAAFVTDEGGITCHAAIVARELKKPCIIGTKIATQVLKDGDMVEVDADKGIVRILEKQRIS